VPDHFGGHFGGHFGSLFGEGGAIPAGGYLEFELQDGTLTVYFVRPGEQTVTVQALQGRDSEIDTLAGSALAVVPTFLDIAGAEYVPATVHTKVVLKADGTEIAALTEVAGWTMGTAIPVPSTWTDLLDDAADREEHVVLFIGDNATPNARSPLRLTIGCVNPER
jgi:hypothetical protein